MKILSEIIKKWWGVTTTCFTLVLLGFSLVGFSITPETNALLCSQIMWMFLFSALVGISSCICFVLKFSAVIKGTVRFVLCYISFVLSFLLGGAGKNYLDSQSANKVLTVMFASLIFIGIYVVVEVISFAVFSVKKHFASKKVVYHKQFDEVKSNSNQ